jgi:type I restriction enzyme S subunit
MSELPKGWAVARLNELAAVSGGIQKQPSRAPRTNTAPFLRVANVGSGRLDLADVHDIEISADELERYRLLPGDLLVVEGNGSASQIGRAARWEGAIDPCVHQNHLIRVRPSTSIEPRFLEYAWMGPAVRDSLQARASSTSGLLVLTTKKIGAVELPVPPLAEQAQIVAAVEEVFSKLDAGEAGLRTVRLRLNRLREAILDAAMTGQLVAPDPSDTPAAKLLTARGIDQISPSDAPSLPADWSWVELGQAACDAGYGTSLKCSYASDGVGVLRIPNVRRGRVDLDDMKRAPSGAVLDNSLFLEPGDLLIIRTNGSRDLVGRSAPVTVSLGCSFASYLIRFRLRAELLNCEFASLQLSARWWRRRLETSAASSAGQYNLSLGTLAPIPVALPPLEEQGRIVAEVDRQFAFVAACERAVTVGLARSAGLRRSVLKAAFEGRLVPQDPSNEPASVMLERVRAERAAQPAAKRRTRKTA